MTIQTNFPAIKPTLLLDFANTEVLDPRITFTRASTATYYGTQTAKAEENLLTRSQELGVGAWSSTNATVTANSTAAPDGTTTADTLIDDTTSGAHICAQVVTLVASSIYTQSFFLKANTNNFAIVTLSSTTTNNYISAVVNLSTGAITQTGTGTSATFTSSSITSVGSGWYRVVITGSTTSGFTRAEVGLAPAATGNTFATNGRIVYVGTGTSIFVWGAQLEQRSAATAYTATTTEPITNYIPQLLTAASGVARFDHNPITFESLGLEIEESRTNLALYSEDLSNAAWTFGNATLSSNTAISPGGTQTADQLVASNSSGNTFARENVTLSAGSATLSVYLKTGGVQFAQFMWAGVFNGTDYANFDLVNGTVTAGTYTAATITPVGNGWYRCTLTSTVTASAGNFIYVNAVPTSTSTRFATYTGNGWNSLYVWGAQLEAGAFATSYIPTVASQVTRAADAASMTGTNFSSWYNAAEGTMYADFLLSANQTTDQAVAQISNGTSTSDSIYIYAQRQSSRFRGDVYIANAAQAAFAYTAAGVPTAGTTYKTAFGYKVNDFAMTINSNTVSTDTTGNVPVVDRMFIGTAGTGGVVLNGTIKKLAYYPLRVTNTQLQALTG